ncbi:MAG TPA: GNAT family N-acetyltransferase [Saccharospirillum sp.]|nr:GNAT family N-acetyltransferase [Saccharospirillum sp.]
MTLKDISIEAGMPIEDEVYLNSLEEARASNCLFDVRRHGALQAYSTLKYVGEGKWHVLMFVTQPEQRNKDTFTELFGKIILHLDKVNAKTLVSNVFKVNRLSVAFHKKLGFKITREAPHGYEFTLALESPEAKKHRQWMRKYARHC